MKIHYRSLSVVSVLPADLLCLAGQSHTQPDAKTSIRSGWIRTGLPLRPYLVCRRIGWYTFRHTFRILLDETGAPIKVQQEPMRHADIRTTMNVYGKAMDESKREAHGKVVRLVLPSKVA